MQQNELPPKLPTQFPPNNDNPQPSNFYVKDSYYQAEFTKIQNSNEVYKGKWNWYAFFFIWIWLFTKGAWGFALIVLVSILLTIDSDISPIVGIGWSVFLGMRGTWIYYNVKTKNQQIPKPLF